MAMARYPSEIKQGVLYLGNMMNVIGKDNSMLKGLGVTTVIQLTPDKFEHLDSEFKCFHFGLKEAEKPEIEFDSIVEVILEQVKKKEPVFVFDISGIVSAAICVKVMLETNKGWSKEIATAFICNKRYEAKDMPGWLY